MKELIEKLQQRSQSVPVPLELPDEDLLVEIEEQIFIPLPADFKTFLLEVSDLVIGSLEPVTVTDPHSHTFLPEVAAQAWDVGVPREFIPLCYDYRGYYLINQNGDIGYWSDGELTDEHWDSVWDWAEAIWLES